MKNLRFFAITLLMLMLVVFSAESLYSAQTTVPTEGYWSTGSPNLRTPIVDNFEDLDTRASANAVGVATNVSDISTNTSSIGDKADKTGTAKITTTNDVQASKIIVTEQATPSNPASGFGSIYCKTNGKVYFLNDAGTEIEIVGASELEGTAILSTGEAGGTKFLREDGDGTCSWQEAGSGSGDLKADGTVPLTADWDVGAYIITGLRFISDVVTGTAPFTVASTTVVTNLNADLLDGEEATAFEDADAAIAKTDVAETLSAAWDLGTPSAMVGTNLSGTGASFTAGTVTNGAYTTNNLSVFSATTSAQLAGIISNKTGTDLLVFGTSPTLATPALGTIASGVGTALTALNGVNVQDDTILEVALDATNAPTDNYILSYDLATGGFTWVVQGGGSMVYPGAGIAVSTGSAWDTSYSLTTLAAALDDEDWTFTGDVDLTSATTSMGNLNFSDTTGSTTDGHFRWTTSPTGLAGNVFSVGNGTSLEYMLQYGTLPTTDGQIIIYNATSDLWVPLVLSGDIAMDETGATTIQANSVEASMIADWYAYDTIPIAWANGGTSEPDDLDNSTRTPYAYRTFASDADEDLNFVWFVPSDLSGTTVQYRVKYLVTNATGPSAEGVAFGLSGISNGDNDITNGTKGTVVVITDPTITASQHDVLITSWSGDVTITNLLAGEVAELALIRDVSDAADDYAQVVGVFAIEIRYVRNVAR